MHILAFAVLLIASFAPTLASGQIATQEQAYGRQPLQTLDFYSTTAAKTAPTIVFVHGGGWRRGDKGNATGAAKVEHFTHAGYAFASINYRLVPDARVEDQAQDVADAVAWLVANAATLHIDPKRVVLMGHSAGAHLSALVATDPRYLEKAGVGLDRLSGVVLLDGAAYDVPAQIADGPPIMRRIYGQAFGSDAARQKALSPTWQAAAPNARSFLILHVDREDGARQSERLGTALRSAGSAVKVEALEGRGLSGHMAINRSLGDADYPGTAIVDAYLASVTAR